MINTYINKEHFPVCGAPGGMYLDLSTGDIWYWLDSEKLYTRISFSFDIPVIEDTYDPSDKNKEKSSEQVIKPVQKINRLKQLFIS